MGSFDGSINDKKGKSYFNAGTPEGDAKRDFILRTTLASHAYTRVSAEPVSFSAGAAGTTGIAYVRRAPICDATGTRLGSTVSTSFAWVTGTILTTSVYYDHNQSDTTQLASLANGEYAIDYDTGRIRYCKATSGTSDTCNYTVRESRVYLAPDYTGDMPASYKGEPLYQFTKTGTVTVGATAGRVYDLGVSTAIQDGTNQLAAVELQFYENGWSAGTSAAPTGSASTTVVTLYRENTADGTAPATSSVDEANMLAPSVSMIPVKKAWGTTKFKITSSTGSMVFNYLVKGIYYTPS